MTILFSCFDDDVALTDFLVWHGLGGTWNLALEGRQSKSSRETTLKAALEPVHRGQIAQQMLQESVMSRVARALNSARIQFVWLKAAAVRDMLYDCPGLRPCTDLDLLVAPRDALRGMDALCAAGASVVVAADQSAHERVFRINGVDIDFHWDVLAPGRLREGVTEQLIARRVETRFGWRPSDHDAFALALVHPAFAKHVCTRHMGLSRVVDTIKLARHQKIDVEAVVRQTAAWGVSAGALASLYWISILNEKMPLSPSLKIHLNDTVSPRLRYVYQWIVRDWPNYWVDKSRLVLWVAFSMWLHDSPRDVIRAASYRLKKRTAPTPLEQSP